MPEFAPAKRLSDGVSWQWLSSEDRCPPAGEVACFGVQQPAEFATAAATAAVEASVEQQQPELAAAEAPALIPGTATAECDRRLATAEAFAIATAAGHETAAPWTTAAMTKQKNSRIKFQHTSTNYERLSVNEESKQQNPNQNYICIQRLQNHFRPIIQDKNKQIIMIITKWPTGYTLRSYYTTLN